MVRAVEKVDLQLGCMFVDCLTSHQHASVSQGQICSDNFTCCHTEIEVADQTFHLTQSQYTDTGPNSHSNKPIMPGPWQGSHWWDASSYVTGMTRPGKIPARAGFEPQLLRGCLNHFANKAIHWNECCLSVQFTVPSSCADCCSLPHWLCISVQLWWVGGWSGREKGGGFIRYFCILLSLSFDKFNLFFIGTLCIT